LVPLRYHKVCSSLGDPGPLACAGHLGERVPFSPAVREACRVLSSSFLVNVACACRPSRWLDSRRASRAPVPNFRLNSSSLSLPAARSPLFGVLSLVLDAFVLFHRDQTSTRDVPPGSPTPAPAVAACEIRCFCAWFLRSNLVHHDPSSRRGVAGRSGSAGGGFVLFVSRPLVFGVPTTWVPGRTNRPRNRVVNRRALSCWR